MKDDLLFLSLLDLYSPLLTQTQREIAEQKGVSRQSVSDCLNKCRKQLQVYEEKLGFNKTVDAMTAEIARLKEQLGEQENA